MWKKSFTIKGLLLAFFGLILVVGQAQELKPCGTPPVKTKWFKKYIKERALYRTAEDTLLYVPLRIHSVANDDGAGHMRFENILESLCRLNLDYSETAIQFYVEGEIDSIDNSAYNSHESVLTGAEMMFEHNYPDAINVYFVSDPAGNCGYNLPYAGIAMSKGCSGPNRHTFAHEVGHNLSVQHPHLGWDGNDYNWEEETPLTLTYDYTYFKDTLIIDTLIIDTSIVEFADGSNCEIAGDFLCDTRADYLSSRWQCDNEQQSTELQKDPNDIEFRSEGKWIMSYSFDACAEAFSEEQIALMRANLLDEKSSYLFKEDPQTIFNQEIELLTPEELELVDYRDIEFSWEEIPGADQYLLQVSLISSFPFVSYQAFTSSTTHVVDLGVDTRYFYRVIAYNRYSHCFETEAREFNTGELTSAKDVNLDKSVIIIPNVCQKSDLIRITSESNILGVKVFNSNGIAMPFGLENNQIASSSSIQVVDYESGVYFMQIQIEGGVSTKKFLVQ